MTEELRDFDILMRSGTILYGGGRMLMLDGKYVGAIHPTSDGLHHVFDDHGKRLDVFATAEEADTFTKRYWKADGSIAPDYKPIKFQ